MSGAAIAGAVAVASAEAGLRVIEAYVAVGVGIAGRNVADDVQVAARRALGGQLLAREIARYERLGVACQGLVGLVVEFGYYREIEAYGPRRNADGLEQRQAEGYDVLQFHSSMKLKIGN